MPFTRKDFSQPVTAAVHTLFSGDSALATLAGGGIHTPLAPDGTLLPYLTFSVERAEPFDSKTQPGQTIRLLLRLYDHQPGLEIVQQITARVMALVDNTVLSITGAGYAVSRLLRCTTYVNARSRRIEAQLRFQVTLSQNQD